MGIEDDLIIAIDGPAGAGKSTIAKEVAKELGFGYLDTGAMYRAVTLKVLQNKLDFSRPEDLYSFTRSSKIEFEKKAGTSFLSVFLDDNDVTEDIRNPEVSKHVSEVSKIPEIREWMTKLQRDIGAKGKWVVDGRDIGTVVFPSAAVKIFLTASIQERGKRRFNELHSKGFSGNLETMVHEISKRDETDSTRATAPLKQANDAVLLDTTNMDIEMVVKKVIEIATAKAGNTYGGPNGRSE
ncbi:(d)CMP kinase [bacterium]|nr:(d)CMP kinase [bacterium]